ncbi:DUF4955 domain-containing protein [Gaetbulibacter aquiaggeris]|uniref:DUF4955 domain-containing protein n=1 Tax=Gaetbulibacter aquiaggeris TaxID=1735373 RepID=A0ABW7MLK0_9FLAO
MKAFLSFFLKGLKLKLVKLNFLIFLFLFPVLMMSQDALIWQKYTGQISDPNIPLLPNYSYAGYMRGEVGIPNTFAYPTFDVTDAAYGAVPNDELSDQSAIQAAIDAAEANGGGVVFFPPGEYLVNTDPNATNTITINSSNIVLKGSGSVPGGTMINMVNYMRLPSGVSDANNPAMFTFSQTNTSSATRTGVGDANAGDMYVTVTAGGTTPFLTAKYCRINTLASTVATTDFLEGRTTKDTWTDINAGVILDETHEIDYIDAANNRIYLKDPVIDTFKSSYSWRVSTNNLIENCGFEDIHLKANFYDAFVHHKDYIHNYGWKGVDLKNVAHSWVRRCKFSNVSKATTITGRSYASSILNILVDGNTGHALSSVGFKSSRILQGLIWDNTSAGQFHGADMSGGVAGSVVWRVDARKGYGLDLHASMPRTNLIDLYTQMDLDNAGGNFTDLPNHLKGLTMWNVERVGTTNKSHNFWNLCGSNYCGLTVVNPIIVGYHGTASTTFSNVKYEESNGAKVFPESLYEAQLGHRIGATPSWIADAINEWNTLNIDWYYTPPTNGGYTETFENMTLINWGTQTYTGNSGYLWTVNAKGVSGYIDASKGVYFHSGVTGVQSGTISGGIGNFSVQCKDLFSAGNDRIIQLLINGNVVGTFTHNGTEVYTYTVENINIEGNITIAIRNASSTTADNTLAIDNIAWTTYDGTLSVDEISTAKAKVKLYPNPVKQSLTLSGNLRNSSSMAIYDLTGKQIMGIKTSYIENDFINLDVSDLKSGFYLIEIKYLDKASTLLKFIKH